MKRSTTIIFAGLMLASALAARAEKGAGIHFERAQNWLQILAKAKAENKYIFVDCMATWCGPCKEMDKAIYVKPEVGDYINAHFISIKVQMDKTKGDAEDVKGWYADAEMIGKKYQVDAYPTFLFVAPDGRIVHRGLGYKAADAFIALAAEATDPNKQCYSLIERYKRGGMDPAGIIHVVEAASVTGDKELAKTAARDFIDHYLNTLGESDLLKEDILVPYISVLRSGDKIFKLFYHRGKEVDALLKKPGFSQAVVEIVISKEEVTPAVQSSGDRVEPDWEALMTTISKQYDPTTADRVVIGGKIGYFFRTKRWPEYAKNIALFVNRYGATMRGDELSQYAWAVFKRSSNNSELNAAVDWIKRAMTMEGSQDGPDTDTYANLLYKLGRAEEAISLELKALKFAERDQIDDNIKTFAERIEKMKKGEPTWPLN